MSVTEMLLLALGGALIGMDVVSFPQAMISRPIVAATLGGTVLGAPATGLLLGAVLELIALETLPVGASRYPEWGSASFVSGALLVHVSPHPSVPAMLGAVLGAVGVGYLGGWTMYVLRRINGSLTTRFLPDLDAGSSSALVRLQALGLLADFVRGALLSFAALLVVQPVLLALVRRWRAPDDVAIWALAGLAVAVAMGAAWKLFHGVPGTLWFFAGGLVIGLGLVATL
ncbi:MAG: PTS sugar transporter subunit IIC [Gemmatimonadaceae bacterium]